MKAKNYLPLLTLLLTLIASACGNKTTQHLEAEVKQEEASLTQAQLDTISVDASECYHTPHMNDGALEEYYATNNKYTDWDKNDKKTVFLRFGCAKDGSTFNVKLMRTCGVEKLDQEAIRLIENIMMDNPATDALGNPLRVRNMLIPVVFPKHN